MLQLRPLGPGIVAWLTAACLVLVLASAGGATQAGGQVRVDGPEALAEALAAAGPGSEILLAPGDYGGLRLEKGGSAGAPLVLRSADPSQPARLFRLRVKGAAHVVLEDLLLDYVYAEGDSRKIRPFEILGSQDITLRRVRLDGDPGTDGFGHAYGLWVRGVRGGVIENSKLSRFARGLIVQESRDIVVRGNEVSEMSGDGMDFAEVTNVLIENNYLHDFNRPEKSPVHPDMIQFWTNRTEKPSTDIVIRRNLLSSGEGNWTQSIFMRNEKVDSQGAGDAMFYRNVRITENLIINAHLHGITVGHTDGLVIANNTLVRNPGSAGKKNNYNLWTPRIRITPAARNVEITRNAVETIDGYKAQDDWTLEGNLQIQDRGRLHGGHYSTVFAGHDPRDPASFHPKAGGPLDGTGIGAPNFRLMP